MSLHSYSRCWLHLVWGTLSRERVLQGAVAAKVSGYLHEYARSKGVYMKINFVNPDHVHTLIDMPTNITIEDLAQFFKGAVSHWINEQNLVAGKFAWARGYGVFSVSHSLVPKVAGYIADQEAHHKKLSFSEELKLFVERYGLTWKPDKTVETVSS